MILNCINTILKDLIIIAATSFMVSKKTNIIKVDYFYRKINKNSIEQIENFKQIKDTNNWQNNRLRFIAEGLMKEEVADWY